jgi:copper chaperone CopZ
MTFAGARALAPLSSFAGQAAKTLTRPVKGFSCPTCATGLDAMLSRQAGIVSSKSTYPEGVVKVSYLPDKITEGQIISFITELGFTVEAHAKS